MPADQLSLEGSRALLQVRAFLLDGTQGVILHREIWHALSRFTLTRGAHADFYFLTDIKTQLEIEAGSAETKTNAYQELSAFLNLIELSDPFF